MKIRINSGEAILFSPFDVHSYIITLPPVKEDLRENAVRFKLRAMHPEDPSNMILDIKSHGLANSADVIVYAANPDTVFQYRTHSLPLISGISFLQAANKRMNIRKNNESNTSLILMETPEWIQAASFIGDQITSITSFNASSLEAKRHELATFIHESQISDFSVIHLTHGCDGTGNLTEAKPLMLSALSVGDSISIAREQIFTKRAPIRKRFHKQLLAFLVCLNLLAGFAYAYQIMKSYENTAADFKNRYDRQQKEIIRVSELKNELTSLMNTGSQKTVSPYKAISALHGFLKNAWIRSLTIQGNTFKFEAEDTDALQTLAAFQASPLFLHVRLQQAAPSALRGEIFTITGEIYQ